MRFLHERLEVAFGEARAAGDDQLALEIFAASQTAADAFARERDANAVAKKEKRELLGIVRKDEVKPGSAYAPGTRFRCPRCLHTWQKDSEGRSVSERVESRREDASDASVVVGAAAARAVVQAFYDELRPMTEPGEWERWGRLLGQAYRQATRQRNVLAWMIGDWLVWGEERTEQFQGFYRHTARYLTGLGPETLTNLAWVARAVSPGRRRYALSLSHHEAVLRGGLSAEQQDELLAQAEQEKWSRDRLRDRVRELCPPRPPLRRPTKLESLHRQAARVFTQFEFAFRDDADALAAIQQAKAQIILLRARVPPEESAG